MLETLNLPYLYHPNTACWWLDRKKKLRFKRKHKKSINVRLVPDVLINKINHHSAQVVNQYLVSHLRWKQGKNHSQVRR